MNGNDFKDLLKRCGLNQRQAAEEFGFTETTISQMVHKGEERISKSLSKKALMYAINDARARLSDSVEEMNAAYNKLCIELEK